MTPQQPCEPVFFVDPLTGEKIRVRSICYPSKTLLDGKEYTRSNGQLGQCNKKLELR
jgi:hypothetical protein